MYDPRMAERNAEPVDNNNPTIVGELISGDNQTIHAIDYIDIDGRIETECGQTLHREDIKVEMFDEVPYNARQGDICDVCGGMAHE